MDKILILDKINCIMHVLNLDLGEKDKATQAYLEARNLDLGQRKT
jgi:hypothetical protein